MHFSPLRTFLTRCPGKKDFLPQNYLLQQILKFGKGRDILVRGESGDGLTSFSLELVKDLQQQGFFVVYCDLSKSLYEFRLYDIDKEKLAYIQAYEPKDILEVVTKIRQRLGKTFPIVYVFDNIHYFSDSKTWNLKAKPEELRDSIRAYDNNCVTIFTERARKIRKPDLNWFEIIEVIDSSEPNHLFNGEKIGKLVKFRGSVGACDLFIDYRLGRISPAFLYAKELILKGEATPLSTFNGVRGIWNYVQSYKH